MPVIGDDDLRNLEVVVAEDVGGVNGVDFDGDDQMVGDAGSEADAELDLEAVLRRFRGVMTLTDPETLANETR